MTCFVENAAGLFRLTSDLAVDGKRNRQRLTSALRNGGVYFKIKVLSFKQRSAVADSLVFQIPATS